MDCMLLCIRYYELVPVRTKPGGGQEVAGQLAGSSTQPGRVCVECEQAGPGPVLRCRGPCGQVLYYPNYSHTAIHLFYIACYKVRA